MQSAMNRLSAFVRRRRKLVAIGWLVLLLLSIPFASRQTENLTGGGFEAPGSGSAEVDKAVKRFQGASSESLGVLLQSKGGDAAAMSAAPLSWRSIAAPPSTANQTKLTPLGISSTPSTNSPIVRPLEMRAMNVPTKGAQEIHHAQ